MLRIAIKTHLDVKVGTLYKRRNAERGSEHLTHWACQRRDSALLHALRRYPTCAAASAVPNPFSARAEPPYTFSTGCQNSRYAST
jgi:hypothetical protein